MAFQEKQPFFTFLQGSAAGAALEVAAPAENYILDERVPSIREDDFLQQLRGAVHDERLVQAAC